MSSLSTYLSLCTARHNSTPPPSATTYLHIYPCMHHPRHLPTPPPSPGEVNVLRDDLCLRCTRHHLATYPQPCNAPTALLAAVLSSPDPCPQSVPSQGGFGVGAAPSEAHRRRDRSFLTLETSAILGQSPPHVANHAPPCPSLLPTLGPSISLLSSKYGSSTAASLTTPEPDRPSPLLFKASFCRRC